MNTHRCYVLARQEGEGTEMGEKNEREKERDSLARSHDGHALVQKTSSKLMQAEITSYACCSSISIAMHHELSSKMHSSCAYLHYYPASSSKRYVYINSLQQSQQLVRTARK